MLNFDPHHWLAEHDEASARQNVADVASVAGRSSGTEKSKPEDVPATTATIATNRRPNEEEAKALLRHWHGKLSRVDEFTSPPGWTINQWLKTLDAAFWIYEQFASQAVRDGWSAHDLFGVLPQKPGWGGLASRLSDARDLKMTNEAAFWRSFGKPQKFPRGARAAG